MMNTLDSMMRYALGATAPLLCVSTAFGQLPHSEVQFLLPDRDTIALSGGTYFGDEMAGTEEYLCFGGRVKKPTGGSTPGLIICERSPSGLWEKVQTFDNIDLQMPVDGPWTMEGNRIIGGTRIHNPKILERGPDGWSVVGAIENTLATSGTRGFRKYLLSGEWLVAHSYGIRNPQGNFDQALVMYRRNAQGGFDHADTIFGIENGVPYQGGIAENRAFGSSFAFDGDRLLIASGNTGYDGTGLGGGAVFVFEEQATGWERVGLIQNPGGSTAPLGEKFGWSMHVEDDQLFVGAPFYRSSSDYRPGRVDVFYKAGSTWEFHKSILGSAPWGGTLDYGNFGFNLAFDSGTLFIGSHVGLPDSPNGDLHSSGTTFAYRECGGRWKGVPFTSSQEGWGLSAYAHGMVAAGGKIVTSAFQRDMVIGGNYVPSVGTVLSADIALLDSLLGDPCNNDYGRPFCGGDKVCPCGSPSLADEGCPNSSGAGAQFRMTGYWAESTVERAQVTGLPAGAIGALYYGERLFGPPLPAVAAGAGLLCLESPQFVAMSQADASGTAHFADVELPHPPPVFGERPIRPLQVLYRDLASSGCPGGALNTTNALMVQLDDY